ncbi:hypothetical protein AAMO2058_001073600 [Amorphochlora amoebiformis]
MENMTDTKDDVQTTSRASLFGMKFDPNEVIRTEKIYLDRLHHLLDNYYHPIRASLGQRKEILGEENVRLVFNVIPTLAGYHEILYKKLTDVKDQKNFKVDIAKVLITHAPYLKMYKGYVNNIKDSLEFVGKNKQKRFKEFLANKQKETTSKKGMDLRSLLLLPIHRLPQYVDLMESMLESTDEKTDGYATIEKAVLKCREINTDVNKALGEYQTNLAKFEQDNKKKLKGRRGSGSRKSRNHQLVPVKPKLMRSGSIEKEFSHSGAESKTPTDMFVDEFQTAWQRSKMIVFKDIPRLVRRIQLKFRSEVKFQANDEDGQWESICQFITTLAALFETQEDQKKLEKAIADQKVTDKSEMVPSLKIIFEKHIGLESKTFKVLQTCHQAILVPAMVKLSNTVFKSLGQQFKDVRSKDGWQIQITIAEAVYVVHTRIEQSLHPIDDPSHFEYQWSLRLSFDKNMEDLKAVFVRIIDVRTNPNMDKAEHEKILHALKGEGYLIS